MIESHAGVPKLLMSASTAGASARSSDWAPIRGRGANPPPRGPDAISENLEPCHSYGRSTVEGEGIRVV